MTSFDLDDAMYLRRLLCLGSTKLLLSFECGTVTEVEALALEGAVEESLQVLQWAEGIFSGPSNRTKVVPAVIPCSHWVISTTVNCPLFFESSWEYSVTICIACHHIVLGSQFCKRN